MFDFQPYMSSCKKLNKCTLYILVPKDLFIPWYMWFENIIHVHKKQDLFTVNLFRYSMAFLFCVCELFTIDRLFMLKDLLFVYIRKDIFWVWKPGNIKPPSPLLWSIFAPCLNLFEFDPKTALFVAHTLWQLHAFCPRPGRLVSFLPKCFTRGTCACVYVFFLSFFNWILWMHWICKTAKK